MIDLEDALAPLVELVEHAPEPPDVAGVRRRGRTRRHRRIAVLSTALLVISAAAIVSIPTIANRGTPRVAGVPSDVDHVRVTLLDGSQLEISGPTSLGLTELPVSFNAELDQVAYKGLGPIPGHSFTVERPARQRSVAIAHYPTGDGHDLQVFRTNSGVDAVVQYDHWDLVVHWSDGRYKWTAWASALDAYETPDGYLVVRPAQPGWRLGPTDAPDVQLGESYAFFPPSIHRVGCPGVALDQFSRCDDATSVRIGALDPTLVDTLKAIDVRYTPGNS
jgi:hypothetical protein